jgi:ABC-2 type transport system permease protein
MSIQSDTLAAGAPTPLRRTRPLAWSIRREVWENRSIWITPLAIAAVIVFGFMLGVVGPHHMATVHRSSSTVVSKTLSDGQVQVTRRTTNDGVTTTGDASPSGLSVTINGAPATPAQRAAMAAIPYDIAAAVLLVGMTLVALFYCLGTLQNERRDRSILFWKSLPVSDLTAVTAKAIVPLAILPAVTFVVILATQLVIYGLSQVTQLTGSASEALVWTPRSVLEGLWVLLYGEITATIWIAPVYGWLLLISGWARRGGFLWAILPPLALSLIERIAFGTTYLWHIFFSRLNGGFEEAFVTPTKESMKAGIPIVGVDQLDPGKFVDNPAVWLGLAFAGACFAGAVWLRRYRDPG